MQVVPEKSSAFITCYSEYPVKWSKYGMPLLLNARALSNNTLWINHTNNENRGYYECQQEDTEGHTWHSFSLLKILSKSVVVSHILQ